MVDSSETKASLATASVSTAQSPWQNHRVHFRFDHSIHIGDGLACNADQQLYTDRHIVRFPHNSEEVLLTAMQIWKAVRWPLATLA